MRISDWSSDVCSSDLIADAECSGRHGSEAGEAGFPGQAVGDSVAGELPDFACVVTGVTALAEANRDASGMQTHGVFQGGTERSEEHTSELQSLMRISYAVFCLKKKIQ